MNKPSRLSFVTAGIVATLMVLLALAPVGCTGRENATSAPDGTTRAVQSEPASGAESFSFIVCGDPQNNYDVFSRVVEAARSVDFIIIAGDLTGSGTATELENFRNYMDSSGVRYYCVPGNHDVATAPSEQLYREYLGATHQSFDYQGCHFVLIDNSEPPRGFYPEEQEWVKEDLAAASKKGYDHVLAVCHVPPGYPYSSRRVPGEEIGMENNEQLVPLLSTGGVEQLFCGHFHVYNQSEEDGMKITITGGAGAPLHLSARNGGYYHYVLLDVDGKDMKQEVIKI